MNTQCLNGWWDFAPATSPETLPCDQEWLPKAYLVPSPYTISAFGVKKPGETVYQDRSRDPRAEVYRPENEFLFDTHGYPPEWGARPHAFARRFVDLPELPEGKRLFLRFEAVAARSVFWLNGTRIGSHDDAFLPVDLEVTTLLKPGANELVVAMLDFPRDPKNPKRTLAPSGNMFTEFVRGIWQDAWLIERGPCFVRDAVIQTSVREQELRFLVDLDGETDGLDIEVTLADWQGEAFRTLYDGPAATTVDQTVSWTDPVLWEPENPHLYELRFSLRKNGKLIDESSERFGFREVWIDGPDLILNGHPVHLFSDWGHKVTCFHHTENWIRQWFTWMKENNLNHTRFHTHPHHKLAMRLADEMGILVTGETAIHGSDGAQAADRPQYWQAAREHIRQYVARDRNHPSLILWSVENEMRWNQDKTPLTREKLPGLYRLFRELDPTREAYHEGDSSMWDESGVAIISRHYGKDCGGIGWWKQDKPLHAGEMASYHYMSPVTNFHNGAGDKLWTDYAEVVKGAAIESSHVIEAGRTTGVCCFGPWNLSCLVNLRGPDADLELDPGDLNAPGVKPLKVPAHTAEFPFWENDGDPIPFVANEFQKDAFRPFALIDLSQRRSYYAGEPVRRTLSIINDTHENQEGHLKISLRFSDGRTDASQTVLELGRGQREEVVLEWTLPDVEGTADLTLAFVNDAGQTLDERKQHWTIHSRTPDLNLEGRSIHVIGKGPAADWLSNTGAILTRAEAFDAPLPSAPDLIILEKNTIQAGTLQNQWLSAALEQGARIFMLEQQVSPFADCPLVEKPCIHNFVRSPAHPMMQGWSDADVSFWGEEAFADLNSDAAATLRPYRKDDHLQMRPLVDGGEGGFGLHLPNFTSLGEIRQGNGILLASQFRLEAKADTIPEARRLFLDGMTYLLNAKDESKPVARETATVDASLLEAAAAGEQVLIPLQNPEAVNDLARATGLDLQAVSETHYQGILSSSDPLTEGLSNDEICGINGFTYCFGETSWPVAQFHLSNHPDLKPLLTTPYKSLLKEFFVLEQRTEALRAYATSVLYDPAAEPEGCLLARLPWGKGELILTTLLPAAESNPRLQRVWSTLRSRLGLEYRNPLAGDSVPVPEAAGTGSPEQVWTATASGLNGSRLTAPTGERMAPTGALRAADWLPQAMPSASQNKPVVLYTCFTSPRARRIEVKDAGIPDPMSLTFLDVSAPGGSLQAFLNGTDLGTLPLKADGISFADLELLSGFNQLLLLWTPDDKDGTLSFRFRNILNQPETELHFLKPVQNGDVRSWG